MNIPNMEHCVIDVEDRRDFVGSMPADRNRARSLAANRAFTGIPRAASAAPASLIESRIIAAIALVKRGLAAKQIAARISIAAHTVRPKLRAMARRGLVCDSGRKAMIAKRPEITWVVPT